MSDAEKPPFPPESNESGVSDAADTAETIDSTAAAVPSEANATDAAAAVPTDGSERAEEVPPAEAEEALPPEPRPAAEARTGAAAAPPKGTRPDLADRREPLYREIQGYRLRLDPPDLARLRELPGSRGKSDTEIGEAFFDGQAERLANAIQGDVAAPSELRVVVDPYSRQAFLALENRIRGILSF